MAPAVSAAWLSILFTIWLSIQVHSLLLPVANAEANANHGAHGKSHEIDLSFLSKHPTVAAEELKIAISKLQQIMSVSNADELVKYFSDPNNATPLQAELIQLLLDNTHKQKT